MAEEISLRYAITFFKDQGAVYVHSFYVGDKRGKKKRELVGVAAVFDVSDKVIFPNVKGIHVSEGEGGVSRIQYEEGATHSVKVRVVKLGKIDVSLATASSPPSWRSQAERLEARRRSLLTSDAAIVAIKKIDGIVRYCTKVLRATGRLTSVSVDVWTDLIATRTTTRGFAGEPIMEFALLFSKPINKEQLPYVDGLTITVERWEYPVMDKPKLHVGYLVVGAIDPREIKERLVKKIIGSAVYTRLPLSI